MPPPVTHSPAPTLSNRLNVNLPVSSPAGSVAFALLGPDFMLDLELSAMQTEGRGEVISSPRVITANQKEALIEQGVEIPYIQPISGTSTAPSVSFKKAVLSLKVTPQITPDDRIIMDLSVTKDSVGQIFQGVPSINTREVNTQVLVDNGATVVLGGVYEQTRSNDVSTRTVPRRPAGRRRAVPQYQQDRQEIGVADLRHPEDRQGRSECGMTLAVICSGGCQQFAAFTAGCDDIPSQEAQGNGGAYSRGKNDSL